MTKLRLRALLTALALVAVSRAPAAEPQSARSKLADVLAGVGRIDFVPVGVGAEFVLTVSGPDGNVERQEFDAGRPILLTVSGPEGKTRPDGVYTWELRPRRAAPAQIGHSGAETPDGRPVEVDAAARSHPAADRVQSGSFWIRGGVIVGPGASEPRNAARSGAGAGRTPNAGGRTALDQVIADDLIVQGSGCIGLDCVNNETFGFHSLRLKENNTRIGFVDTSATVGFPTNDWMIQANSGGSGGASYLGFVDQGAAGGESGADSGTLIFQVTAGAPANSLLVDSTGRIGLRTATPVLDIHANTSNTPALRLEQNSSGGFTAQTWDIAGNEANFFVRDVTGGSRLPFRIRPGAPTSSIDIAANGWVGINQSSPGGNFDIHDGTATNDIFAGMGVNLVSGPAFNFGYAGSSFGRSAGFFNVRPDASAVAPNPSLRFMTANVQRMIITNLGNVGIGVTNPSNPLQMASGAFVSAGGVWTNASSREFKDNIRSFDAGAALETLHGLEPVTYTYKAAPGEAHVGFIAEDVPSILATPDRKGMSPMDVTAVLTRVVQEQQKTIEELRARVEELERRK